MRPGQRRGRTVRAAHDHGVLLPAAPGILGAFLRAAGQGPGRPERRPHLRAAPGRIETEDRMRILWHGPYKTPTGYWNQAEMWIKRLIGMGHEVGFSCLAGV